jgi:protein-disulfide isomerase
MPNVLKLPVGPRDHRQGPDDAPVTLVEYGDFECPQCAAAHPILKHIKATFGDGLRLVFRHFPLTSSHPNAQRAAEAAEWVAAQNEDAFWSFHDALYADSKSLSEKQIVARIEEIGLSGKDFLAAWQAHTHLKRVKEDFIGGIDSGVTGTPAFFINGVRHPGTWDEIALVRAIESAARDARGAAATVAQRSG